MYILILIAFHFIFFWSHYTQPFRLATSELISTFFPTWIWQGREWRKGKIPKYDHFWLNAHSHPVLSTYYPPSILSSFIGSFKGLDKSFNCLLYSMLAHYLFMSYGYYLFLGCFGKEVALFGALTFTYQSYHIKQQPCVVYTLAWFPWVLLGISSGNFWLAGFAIGMMLLSGYYPLAVYLLPAAALVSPSVATVVMSYGLGLLIGLPQVVPFLKYLPKTIRNHKNSDMSVGFWEKRFYFGLIPLIVLIFNFKALYLVCLVPVVVSLLLKRYLPRVHQRLWLLGAYLAIFYSLYHLGVNPWPLLIIQAFDLWFNNRNLIPTRPFSELYQKPSILEKKPLVEYLKAHLGDSRVSGLPHPLFTGHLFGFKTLGYSGGMQLKLMAKWRNDNNPNGAGEHDWFKSNNDNESLDRSNVKYAFSSKKIAWERTEIRNLYRNPRIS